MVRADGLPAAIDILSPALKSSRNPTGRIRVGAAKSNEELASMWLNALCGVPGVNDRSSSDAKVWLGWDPAGVASYTFSQH